MESHVTNQNLILKLLPAVVILISTKALGSTNAQDKFVCGQAGDLRFISVDYLDPPKAVPCRVVYTKTQEGTVKYPWNAKNQSGYCEKQAQYLAKKLSGLGVTCRKRKGRAEANNPL